MLVTATISPPAARMRLTTAASSDGTYPCSTGEAPVSGIPAIEMLSLSATRLPRSGPSAAPASRMEQRRTIALYGSSASPSGPPGSRTTVAPHSESLGVPALRSGCRPSIMAIM